MSSKRSAPEPEPEPEPVMVPIRYTGGGEYVPGVPATDLAVDGGEAERLVSTGLYVYEPDQAAAETPKEGDQ